LKLPERCAGLRRIVVLIILYILFPVDDAFSGEQVILKLVLNEQDRGEFFLTLAPGGDIWMEKSDFEQLGLKEGPGRDVRLNAVTYVSLKSIAGLEYRINEEKVSLDMKASPSLFREHDVDISYTKPYEVVFSRDISAFLNYSIYYDYREGKPSAGASGELGMSAGNYLGITTFAYRKTHDSEKTVRLMTGITRSDRDKMQTLALGDFSASSGPLGSVSLLGGISYSKNFSIDPSLLIFPPLNLGGTLETPSDVELYLDGSLIRREKLSPGRFTFNEVPATAGPGTAKIIIKDVYGREKTITTPYYYSERLLRKGLHEYSYNLGFTRNDFGAKSFSYGKLSFMGFHNFGFSGSLKAGFAAEASPDLINIGPSVSFLAFRKGVADAALAVSNSSGESGLSGMFGYSYQIGNLNARLSLRSDSVEYSNLAVKPSDDKARFQFTGAIGLGGKKTGFLTAEYSHADMYRTDRFSRLAVSYGRPLTETASLFITASRTKNVETTDEIFFGIHAYLGKDFSGSVNYSRTDDSAVQKVSFNKNLPSGGGFGYRADIVNSDSRHVNGTLSYQNNYGLYEMDLTRRAGDTGYGLSVSGGIGYIDRTIFMSRPVTDSFAKVKVDKLKDVRAYYYGNEIGRTDKNGELIITNIRSFQDNKISIESQDIPFNYSIASLSRYISPSLRSGSVVEFGLSRIQAVTGNIYIAKNGAESPAEFARLFIQGKDGVFEGLVGRNGEFYMENVPHGRHPAKIVHKGDACGFIIIIPDSDEMLVDMGNITCEQQN